MPADARVAQRVREVRKQQRVRRVTRAGFVVVPLTAVAGLLFSPVLDVDTVRVSGNRQLSTAQVLDLARVSPGSRMLTVDSAAVESRISSAPVVATVSVRRDWPGTVRIEVVERQPAIGVTIGGRLAVYDAEGVEISEGTLPPGVPMLRVPSGGNATADVVAAAVTVVRALPLQVRRYVVTLTATSVDDLMLTLRDGATVVWGSRERSADKARVLAALLPRHARRYDIRSPDNPAVS